MLNIKSDLIAQQSETKFMSMIIMNLVTPKVVAKHELLFNKLASGVTKFTKVSDMILVTRLRCLSRT